MAKPCKNKRSPYGGGSLGTSNTEFGLIGFFSRFATQFSRLSQLNCIETVTVFKFLALRDMSGRQVPRLLTQLGSVVECETPIRSSHSNLGWLRSLDDESTCILLGLRGKCPARLFSVIVKYRISTVWACYATETFTEQSSVTIREYGSIILTWQKTMPAKVSRISQ